MRISKKTRFDRPIFLATHALLALFTLYATTWLTSVTLTLSGHWQGQLFGIDIAGALTHMTLLDHGLFYLLCGLAFATQTLLILRRKAAVYAMAGCVAVHLAFWVQMSLNPIWASPIGLAVIAVETLILLLLLRLQQVEMLR
ncbi:hypothetical protein [Maricaulis sp.]|uniref:hypothetical protein n=1 Tax=Maricaulis sp. TaxID=1486257 RepID=UPI003A94DA16